MSEAPKSPILWKGQLVGFMLEPKRFPALWRGRWMALEGEHTAAFVEALRAGRHLWVECGEELEMGVIETEPVNEVTFMLSDNYDEQRTLPFRPAGV